MEISVKQWWHDELSGVKHFPGQYDGLSSIKHLPGYHVQQLHGGISGIFLPNMISKEIKVRIINGVDSWEGDRKLVGRQAISDIDDFHIAVIFKKDKLKAIASISELRTMINVSRLATAERGFGEKIMNEIFLFAKKMNKGVELYSLPEAEGFYKKIGMTQDIKEKSKFTLSADDIKKKSFSEELADLEPENGVFCYRQEKKSLELQIIKGGPGSGNFGHAGREGQVGGSDDSLGGNSVFMETKLQNGQRVLLDGSQLPEYLVASKVRIPPAWTQVAVSRDPSNGLWVKGRDGIRSEKFPEGRPTAIYSPDFKKQSAHVKFARVLEMAQKWDSISRENDENMQSKDPKIKEAALVIKLIMITGIRPGSETDTGAVKKAYGATTLEGRHVVQDKKGVRLEFVGKKGKDLSIPIKDKEVVDMIVQKAKSVGSNGKLFNIDDDQLRDYTHILDGGKFKTKDFRTLLATRTAIEKIKSYGDQKPRSEKEYKKMVRLVAVEVSMRLGNTPAVALQSYINPVVFKGWRI